MQTAKTALGTAAFLVLCFTHAWAKGNPVEFTADKVTTWFAKPQNRVDKAKLYVNASLRRVRLEEKFAETGQSVIVLLAFDQNKTFRFYPENHTLIVNSGVMASGLDQGFFVSSPCETEAMARRLGLKVLCKRLGAEDMGGIQSQKWQVGNSSAMNTWWWDSRRRVPLRFSSKDFTVELKNIKFESLPEPLFSTKTPDGYKKIVR